MALDLGDTRTLVRIGHEDHGDQIAGLRREPVRELVVRALDLREESGHGVLVEGQVAREKNVEDDTDGPNVGCKEGIDREK